MLLFPLLNKYKARMCTRPAGASAPGSPCAGPVMPTVVPGPRAVSLPCCWAGEEGGGSRWSDCKRTQLEMGIRDRVFLDK